jgi:hypothetical protein
MPDMAERGGERSASTVLTNARLEFAPDRMRLLFKVSRDSASNVRVSVLDSVNVIRYTGTVSDLRVSARIEDVESGQVLTIQPDESLTPMFRLEHQPQRNAVVFRWQPALADAMTRTFRVTIIGSGVPHAPSGANGSDTDMLPAGLRMTGSTQFVLNTVVENETPTSVVMMPGGRDTVVVMRDTGAFGSGQPLGEFWIDPARDRINTIVTREWTNRISVGGADPSRDLTGLPRVRILGEQIGDVQRYIDQRAIVLKGRSPRSGTITVEVSAQRRDGQTRTAVFTVTAQPLGSVEVPEVMYPNVDYVIDPRLPSVDNARAVVRDGDREVASATDGVLRVRPSMRDTGRTFLFERIVDGTREGATRSIVIRSFGVPVIRDVKRDADPRKRTVIVQFYSSDRSVNRPTLRVVDGNASEPKKLSGYLRAADGQKPTTSWLEVFEVTQRDPNRPFTFRLQAFDDRGRGSTVWIED